MQECLLAIAETPAIGSWRIGQLLGIPELQWRRVGKTKLWLWYVDRARHVDLIRLVSTDQIPRQAMLSEASRLRLFLVGTDVVVVVNRLSES